MARLLREMDWSSSELGHPNTWPLSLRVAVRILIGSGYPMYIAWGPRFIQIYNDAYRPILGRLKHPAALGLGSPQTFPELWEFIGPMFARVLEQGQNTTLLGQALYLNRNGYLEECYYDFSYSPIPDDDLGKVGGVLVTCSEVTAQVLEQRRLKTVRDLGSSHAQTLTAEEVCLSACEVLAQNSFDVPFAGIYLSDESGRVANLVAASGAQRGEPVCPEQLPIDEDSVWPVRSAMETLTPQHVGDLPSRFPRIPTGAWPETPIEALLIPFNTTSAPTTGFIIFGINARKQLDDAMEQFLLRCAQTISGRVINAHAYEDARRRAESLAELDRAKTVFFSNISHEFRTPLTLIASPLEDLAASPALVGNDRERVDLAQRNVVRLQRLVTNLLDFSRIEAGRANASFEPVDLASLTTELASGFQSTFEKAGVPLLIRAETLSAPVFVDREMWEKIVLNLLSNAFKFTLAGQVALDLAEEADLVRLRVADTGVGIPSTEMPKLFQRFHRVEGARGRSYEGTGIGLALVQELVKLHGGTIAAESTEGVGTTFTITLRKGSQHLEADKLHRRPSANVASARVGRFVTEALRWLDQPAELQLAPLSDLPADESDVRISAKRHRILVVDDNADMRTYLHRLLEPLFQVDSAKDGEDALHYLRRARPDLVLTDAMMPRMDGYSLLTQIRSTPEIATIPIVMLSARAGAEMEIEGREAGADDYVTKPFSGRELLARIGAALKIAEVRASSEKAIRAVQDYAREILERTTDAVFMLDRNWRFTYLNPNAVDLIANGRDLLGKNVWDEFPEAVGAEFWRQYHRVMLEGVKVEFQEYYPAPLEKWFEVHAYPTAGGIGVFFHDTTLKIKAEAALRQSEKLAAVGRLASSIAHEINNPLEAITNLLFLMESDDGMQAQTRELLKAAQSELARVSHIATQTLSFHRQSARPVPVSTTEILDSVLSLSSARLSTPGVSVERPSPSNVLIHGFPGELRQLFSNLLRNALDAIGPGGRLILRQRVSTHHRTGKPGVRITIADTGHGMTRDVQSRLFEPFFSTKPATGTGLGLWVSKQIIDKHCGAIRVRSSADPAHHGTVFTVFLPSGITTPQQQISS